MIQCPWDKLTLTGRLLRSEQSVTPPITITVGFIAKCLLAMGLDLCLYFLLTIGSYRLIAWTFFTPAERGFYCNDMDIREEYIPNTVPTLALLGWTLGFPFFVIIYVNLVVNVKKGSKDLANIFNQSIHVYLDYTVAFWIAILVIDLTKCFVGRTRPNFLEMCQPRELDDICAEDLEAFVPMAHCKTASWRAARNAKMSFPSGHAALSTFACLFLFFYLRTAQRRHPYIHLKLLMATVSSAFTVFTVFCCISRVTDGWHYPTDVIGGITYGAILFHLLLRKYY